MFDPVIEKVENENGCFPLSDDTTLIIIECTNNEQKNYKYRSYSECALMYEEVKKHLHYLDYSVNEINQIYIALDEMCLNEFNQGNKNNPEKFVEISVEINCAHACFSISDEGEGFNPESVPDPTENLEKLLDEDLEEKYTHGRGVWIAKQYMDSVVFNEKGNSVKIIEMRKNRILRTQ